MRYTITAARPDDLPLLPALELAAARLLVGHAPDSVLNETTPADVLEKAQRAGQLWIARADDVVVGFAHAEVIERDTVHLEEMAIVEDETCRGLDPSRRVVMKRSFA